MAKDEPTKKTKAKKFKILNFKMFVLHFNNFERSNKA